MTPEMFVEQLKGRDNLEVANLSFVHGGVEGVLIRNTRFETLTHFENGILGDYSPDRIETMTAQGRNVKHLSRVTGYYAYIEGWNKGKIGELADRHTTAFSPTFERSL